jgi:hypothetical protein
MIISIYIIKGMNGIWLCVQHIYPCISNQVILVANLAVIGMLYLNCLEANELFLHVSKEEW